MKNSNPLGNCLKMETPSLERFYPADDEELGITRSKISEKDTHRHYRRYGQVIELIKKNVSDIHKIADIGSGSGYGTNQLRMEFGNIVQGVEPNDFARKYATKHYPDVPFADDADPDADVFVFVESIEHMTPAEFRSYTKGAGCVIITTPLIDDCNNEYHIQSFDTAEDVNTALYRAGFVPIDEKVEVGITFTTGEKGSQYYGLYGRIPESDR